MGVKVSFISEALTTMITMKEEMMLVTCLQVVEKIKIRLMRLATLVASVFHALWVEELRGRINAMRLSNVDI